MSTETIAIDPDNVLYPSHLASLMGGKVISCVGNADLLTMRAIGICGSRNASDDALQWARRFGAEAAERKLVVVSGYAKGVDKAAHKGALESGGNTIAVLPQGISHFRVNRELKPNVRLMDNFLAVSIFPNSASWQSWRAMERNKLIVGLSSDMFVIEARQTGGTIHAAMECVRQGKRLWAIAYANSTPGRAGNLLLLQDKAIPLNRIADVRKALDDASQNSKEDVRQLAMNWR